MSGKQAAIWVAIACVVGIAAGGVARLINLDAYVGDASNYIIIGIFPLASFLCCYIWGRRELSNRKKVADDTASAMPEEDHS